MELSEVLLARPSVPSSTATMTITCSTHTFVKTKTISTFSSEKYATFRRAFIKVLTRKKLIYVFYDAMIPVTFIDFHKEVSKTLNPNHIQHQWCRSMYMYAAVGAAASGSASVTLYPSLSLALYLDPVWSHGRGLQFGCVDGFGHGVGATVHSGIYQHDGRTNGRRHLTVKQQLHRQQ